MNIVFVIRKSYEFFSFELFYFQIFDICTFLSEQSADAILLISSPDSFYLLLMI